MLIHSSPLWIVLIVILIALVVGAFPTWPYARTWGHAPSGLMFLILLMVLLILLF